MKRYPKYKDSGVEWLGEIPEHWKSKRAKYFFHEIDERSETGNEELLSVSHITGVTPRSEKNVTMFMAESYEGYKTCIPNDLVINIMWAWMGALGISQYKGIVSSAYGVYRQKQQNIFHCKYLDYLIRTPQYIAEYNRRSKGIRSSRLRMYSDDFFQILMLYPPLEEQNVIVRFIDRKLVQIDKFISNKQQLIELLREQKTAIINRAVTKGLNPDAAMKPSGIEWLGDIPKNWKVKRVKYISQILRGKFTHRPRNDPRMYDGKYPFIQTGDITSAQKYIKEYHQTLSEEGFTVSKQFPKGTLVMTIAANIGDIAILDFEACFPDSIVGFVPKDFINIDYLYNLFVAMRQELFRVAPINTQLNLNVERIGTLWAVVPPMQEQVEIVTFIEAESTKIDDAISKSQKEIELIQEYRTTLISNAVTGKIDVRHITTFA
jgi:type I restriction enzyme, S subunit